MDTNFATKQDALNAINMLRLVLVAEGHICKMVWHEESMKRFYLAYQSNNGHQEHIYTYY